MQRRYKKLLECARLTLAHDGHGDHDHHGDRENDAHERGQHVVRGDGVGVVPRADAHVIGRRRGRCAVCGRGTDLHSEPGCRRDGGGRGNGVRGVDDHLDRHGASGIRLLHEIGREDDGDIAQVEIAARRHRRKEAAALLAPRLIEHDRGLVPHVRTDGKAEHDEIDDGQEESHADRHRVAPHLNELLCEQCENAHHSCAPLCRRS